METTHPAVTVQVEFWAQTMRGQFLSISKDITHPCICLSPVHPALVRLEQYHDQVQYPEINAAHASPVSSPYLFFWQPWYCLQYCSPFAGLELATGTNQCDKCRF